MTQINSKKFMTLGLSFKVNFPSISKYSPELIDLNNSFINNSNFITEKIYNDLFSTSPNKDFFSIIDIKDSNLPSLFNINEKIIKPISIGFLPKEEWHNNLYSLNELNLIYFKKKNLKNSNDFLIKLYNCLNITSIYPSAYSIIGVIRISLNIIKINFKIFGKFIGINSIKNLFFNKQGEFYKYEFEIIKKDNLNFTFINNDIDDIEIILLKDLKMYLSKNYILNII